MRPARPADVASRAGLIARQRRHRHRLRRVLRSLATAGRILAAGLVVTALGVTATVGRHWLVTTPVFHVRVVEVQGVTRLDEADVRAAAAVAPGTSLLALDAAAVEARVAALAGVRRVRVTRHLPGRITLLVEEREPYALVSAGALHWIDAEGWVVESTTRPASPPLPVLSGLSARGMAPGEAPSARLQAGLALLRALQRTSGRLAARVSEIDLAPRDGPVLYLVDGVEVRVGDQAWPERLARLDGLLAEVDARRERVAAVDLRFRDLVVLTPWPGAASAHARRRPAGVSSIPASHTPERR
jgi:cell division protein FtsQ